MDGRARTLERILTKNRNHISPRPETTNAPYYFKRLHLQSQKGEHRIVFTMDITRCLSDAESPPQYSFKNSLIVVKENLAYDSWDKNKIAAPICKDAIDFAAAISKDPVRNSRDLVYFMMVYMNHMVSCEMIKYKNGIYRSVKSVESNSKIPDDLPDDVYRYLKFLKSSVGQYVVFNDMKYHNHLELDTYLHISSPIRRLVDLLNLIQIQENLGLLNLQILHINFTLNGLVSLIILILPCALS